MESVDVKRAPLLYIKLSGLFTDSWTLKLIHFAWFNCSMVLIIMGLYTGFDDIDLTMEAIQFLVVHIHSIIKFLKLYIHRSKFESFFTRRKDYMEVSEQSPEGDRLRYILTTTEWVLKVALLGMATVTTLNALKPFIFEYPLVFPAYIPDGYTTWVLVLQEYYVFSGAFVVVGFDVLFCACCVEIVVQFKYLSHLIRSDRIREIREGEEESFLNRWKGYMRHHDFLLRTCQELNDLVAIIMTVEIALTGFAVSMELIVLANNHNVVAASSFCLGIIFLMSIYCFSAEYIERESLLIADSTFESKWYEHFLPKHRQLMLMMIQRSRRKAVFSTYGFININLGTFMQILKGTVSVFTCIQAATLKHH